MQVATINGQQVLIRPTGNNQAQVVAQLTSSTVTPQVQQTQITTPTSTATTPVKQVVRQLPEAQPTVQATPTLQQALQTPQKVATQQDPNQIDQATMEQLLVGQPPGTVIKCVTAQVIQTPAGPRIVLQGLQGADFTTQQLAAVQQQVKQQLLKGNALKKFFLYFTNTFDKIIWKCKKNIHICDLSYDIGKSIFIHFESIDLKALF